MAEIRHGLTSYLSETALHGFKYIGFNNGKLLKVLWVRNYHGKVVERFKIFYVFYVRL